jgi:hypothetical protein
MQLPPPFNRPPTPEPVRVNTVHVARNYELIANAARAMRDYVAQGAQPPDALDSFRPELKYGTMAFKTHVLANAAVAETTRRRTHSRPGCLAPRRPKSEDSEDLLLPKA